jgi:hypothetical protein
MCARTCVDVFVRVRGTAAPTEPTVEALANAAGSSGLLSQEDAEATYGAITAANLGAQAHIIAYAGKGDTKMPVAPCAQPAAGSV